MNGGWPLVGRADELERGSSAILHGRGAVVAGPAGVGRTRLAEAMAHRLGPAEWFAGGGALPFAPFARLLEDRPVIDRFAAATRALVGDPPLVVVDDAHLLDDVSVAFLHHLLAASEARLLLTVCDDEPVPPAITALWKDGALARLPLATLPAGAMDQLVDRALPGDVDVALRRWLTETAAGNPLFLRELLADGIERGAITCTAGRWSRTTVASPPTARLVEVVAARLGSLTDAERRAMELVAIAQPVALVLLEQLVPADVTAALERRELLAASVLARRVQVRLAHPVHAEVVLGRLGPIEARAHRRALIDALAATGARRTEDRASLALWQVQSGDTSDWSFLLDVAREVGVQSDRALAAHATDADRSAPPRAHLDIAATLARAAFEAGGGLAAATLLLRLTVRLGRRDEARELDARLDGLVANEADRIEVARVRADVSSFSYRSATDALDELEAAERDSSDPSLRVAATAMRSMVLAFAGQPAAAVGAGEQVLADPAAGRRDRQLAVAGSAGALCQLGRTDEAQRLIDEALADISPHDEPVGVLSLVLTRIYALLLQGQVRAAERLALGSRAVAEQTWSDDGLAVIDASLASTALALGQPVTALLRARRAEARMLESDPQGMRRVAVAIRAQAYAYLGDAERAARAIADLDAIETPHAAIQTNEARARAWAEVAAGRTADAVATLARQADEIAATGARNGALAMLHDVARLGGAALVVDRAQELAAGMDGPLPATIAAYVTALAGGDGLDDAAHRFGQLGTALWEAEAWSQAAIVHDRADRSADAAAARSRARTARADCEGARTPALAPADPLTDLTPREREIAALAAQGEPDREIAAKLELSVRTVQAHLYRVYGKLGVSGRRDLRDVLR